MGTGVFLDPFSSEQNNLWRLTDVLFRLGVQLSCVTFFGYTDL